MNLNKAMIIGNLTRDPEVRQTPQGASVASFTVATNMIWKDQNGQKQQRPEYHQIVAWRGLADIASQYLHRGSKVYIEGRLQTRDWEGQDGVKRYRTEIIAENIIMLDSKGGSGQPAPLQSSQPISSTDDLPTIQADEQSANLSQDDEINIEDIPF